MTEVPIPTQHLFEPLEQKLISLLKSLSAEDWNKPTAAKCWTVKDVTAHLLDTQLRALALSEKYSGDRPDEINSYGELVSYLNRLNADWVKAMKRVSPATLISLLQNTQADYCRYIRSLKPFERAPFSVAWAGEEESLNWFHVAREYTERWHHQQQIRDAVDKPGIMEREFFFPLIQTFMMALPHSYRNHTGKENEIVSVIVSGHAGGEWKIQYKNQKWGFMTDPTNKPDTIIIMDADTSWKLMTKALPKEVAREKISITGNKQSGQPIFDMISIMG